jgi:hypothetical protein
MAELDAGALFGVKGLIVVVTGGATGRKLVTNTANVLTVVQVLG